MGKQTRIRIGTRSSKLAQWQAHRVEALLNKAFQNIQTEIVRIETSGDMNVNQPISEIGGKGIFLKELEHPFLIQI